MNIHKLGKHTQKNQRCTMAASSFIQRPRNNGMSSRHTKRSSSASSIRTIAFCLVTGFIGFYAGVLWGMQMGHTSNTETTTNSDPIASAANPIQQRVITQQQKPKGSDTGTSRFSPGTAKTVYGATRVNRLDFAKKFDMGVPLDPSQPGNNEVLILHNRASKPQVPGVDSVSGNGPPPLLSVDQATKSCDNLHVVLTDYNPKRKQCIAVMGQYEAFHIQKWMRLPLEKKPIDSSVPLRLVNRGAQQNGGKSTNPPTREQTKQYWEILQTYLSALDDVLAKLKPLAEKVAINNTVIVMVCNMGQSELLLNFACSARAKGLDTSHVLVFATDEETLQLAQGIGLTAFYDEINFKRMPSGAARVYLDRNFAAMMMAKVFCVQMVSMLGYDVLFQDVDVIWYSNPLEYFHDTTHPNYGFDIYFQDDGNHALFYAPYSANTGMYYMRQNDRTQYFMNSFLLAGDLILSTKSHQIALIALLNEHASMYGLKVKIQSRDEDEFPGGFHYHRRKAYMKELVEGTKTPYIFHMSWTKNKDNKLLFMRQMGMWYLQDKCIAKTAENIGSTSLVDACCLAEPNVSCHYSDKPSKIPCKDSPPIDQGRPSWW